MRMRIYLFVCLTFTMSLFAQTEQKTSEEPWERPVAEGTTVPRRLNIFTESQTAGYIAKFDGSGGTTDSLLFEDATNGRIGMFTATPSVKFHIYSGATSDMFVGIGPSPAFSENGPALNFGYGGGTYGRGAGFINVRPDVLATGVNPSLRFATGNTERMIITNAGRIGIGTTDPAYQMHIVEPTDVVNTLEMQSTNTGTNSVAVLRTRSDVAATSFSAHGSGRTSPTRFGNVVGGWAEMLTFSGNGLMIGTNHSAPLILGTAATAQLTIGATGNVGIGAAPTSAKLHVAGDLTTSGNITGAKVIGAVYQDLAEWVPATTDMVPGTVVVLNTDKTNEVMMSSQRYDTSVAGVVSYAPGIILGIEDASKEQIATTGRVKVRVDARSAPVKVGDLLVTGDLPGTAMRSEPMEIHGRKFHQPGTIIGKALEPLQGGVGEILVLLSMQ